MAQSNLDLVVRLKDLATKDIDKAARSLDDLGDAAEQASKRGQMVSNAFAFAGGALITKGLEAAAGAFETVTDSVIGTNAQLQNSATSWEVMLGGADAAQKKLDDLNKFAATTPFEFPGVDNASRLLETFGGAALNTMDNLTMVGDVASGVNKPFEDVAFWTGRMYDALQSGKPFGDAAAELQTMGALSGTTRTKMEEMQKAGAAGSEIWQVFGDSMGRFNGLMAKQSQNFSGLTSTFSDTVNMLAAQAGRPIFDALSEGLGEVNDLLASPAAAQGAQAIADGLEDAIESGVDFAKSMLSVADAVEDGAMPALASLGTFTTIYAGTQLPMMTRELGLVTRALYAKGVAAVAALGPIGALAGGVAVAVGAAVWQMQRYGEELDAISEKQLVNNASLKANAASVDAFNTSQAAQTESGKGLLDSLAALESEYGRLNRARVDFVEKHAFGIVPKNEDDRGYKVYQQLTQAMTDASNRMAVIRNSMVEATTATAANAQAVEAQAQAASLAAAEIDALNKSMESVIASGPAALGAVTAAENQFMAEREAQTTAHWQAIAAIDAQLRGEITASQRGDLEAQRAQEAASYAQSQQAQAVAYALEAAAQRQHLGEMLLEYTTAQAQLKGVSDERLAQMTAAITTEYGVQQSTSQQTFNAMIGHIDEWAANTNVSAGSVIDDLSFAEETAQNTEAAMTALAKDYTANLIQNFEDGKIDADELTLALSQVPSIITSRIENNYAEAAGAAREVSLAVRSVPEKKLVRIEAMIDGQLERHSPAPIEEVMAAVEQFAKVKHVFEVGLSDSSKQDMVAVTVWKQSIQTAMNGIVAETNHAMDIFGQAMMVGIREVNQQARHAMDIFGQSMMVGMRETIAEAREWSAEDAVPMPDTATADAIIYANEQYVIKPIRDAQLAAQRAWTSMGSQLNMNQLFNNMVGQFESGGKGRDLGAGTPAVNGDGSKFGGGGYGIGKKIGESILPPDVVNRIRKDAQVVRGEFESPAWQPVIAGFDSTFLTVQTVVHDHMATMGRHGYEVIDLLFRALKDLQNMADSTQNSLNRLHMPSGGNAGGLDGLSFGGFRADGGMVAAGNAYVVGERGPEMFYPSRSGYVAPSATSVREGDMHFHFGSISIGNGMSASQVKAAIKQGVKEGTAEMLDRRNANQRGR